MLEEEQEEEASLQPMLKRTNVKEKRIKRNKDIRGGGKALAGGGATATGADADDLIFSSREEIRFCCSAILVSREEINFA